METVATGVCHFCAKRFRLDRAVRWSGASFCSRHCIRAANGDLQPNDELVIEDTGEL